VIPDKQKSILQIGMAAPNFTGDGQPKTLEDLSCSSDLTSILHGQLTFCSILNSILSVTAFLRNALILIAPHKEPSLHIRHPNFCFAAWQQLISVLVLFQSLSLLPI